MKPEHRLLLLSVILFLACAAFGCRSVSSEPALPTKTEPAPPKEQPTTTKTAHPTSTKAEPLVPYQEGIASWYGPGFQGKKTSSKEIYNMHDLTAAHQSLPFETNVMVTNLRNGRSVIVRINDRGPFVKDRVIDLSLAAAKVLDMVDQGTAPVRLDILTDRSPPLDSVKFSVQIGSFSTKKNALALKEKLIKDFPGVYIADFRTSTQVYYRVQVKAKTREEAQKIAGSLQAAGYTVIVLEEQ
jgi:rare lipoprotein A